MLDRTVFKEKIINALKSVHDLTESFFNPEEGSIPKTVFPEGKTYRQDLISRWPSYPALRTARAEALFLKIQPIILEKLSNAVDADRALISFDKFLSYFQLEFSYFHYLIQTDNLLIFLSILYLHRMLYLNIYLVMFKF